MNTSHPLQRIPYFGCGIGLRTEIANATATHRKEIDVLEIIAEHYFDANSPMNDFLRPFQNDFPIIPHGIRLSIGSSTPISRSTLKDMRALIDRLHAPYYSDHFALTGDGEFLEIGHLSPLWYTEEMLEHVVRRIDTIQQYIGVPLVLENITAPFIIGEADFEEPEFITEVCHRTGCGLLLDVTNVYINCFNEKRDTHQWLSRYPMDSVVHVHLAGGELGVDGHLYDTHSREISGVNEPVWSLLEWVVQHASIKTLIIERDDDFSDDFDVMVLNDLNRARACVTKQKTV